MSELIPKKPFFFGLFVTKLHKKWAIPALIAVFIATGITRFNVVVFGKLTDSLSAQPHDIKTIWFWAIAYPVLFFIGECTWRTSGFTGMRWFMKFRQTAYQALYSYLSLHSKDYFSSRFAGALVNKIANAVDGTASLFESMLWRFTPLVLGFFWYAVFAWVNNPWLGAIIAIWSILFVGINIWFAKKLEPKSYDFAASLSTLKGRFVDSLSNISLVHEYAYVAGEREYVKQFINKQTNAGLARWMLSEWILVSNGILLFIFMLAMLGTSVYLFQTKVISIGAVIMTVAMVGVLIDKLLFLGQDIGEAVKRYGEAKEGLQEILRDHVIVDSPYAKEVAFSKGSVVVEAMDFAYENIQVFQNFSLMVPAGQKIGLVGKSGAGKSTLVSLLLRHFDTQKGNITIDGESIYDVKLESLRRAIAFVPQDTSLFHRTIRENIRYSNPHAKDKDVERSARLAQAHDFIKKLPQGYETLVGERGVKLSGGQRQRIAIARAFLKNAPILILDEATSSLDSESEHAIQLSLEKLMKDRTVIAIAHRLSTLKKMDRIVMVEDGKIIEDGTPDELLKKKSGKFKNMWDHQVKGFIIDE